MRGVWIRGRRGDLVSASRRNNLSIPVRVWGPQRFAITNFNPHRFLTESRRLPSDHRFGMIASVAFSNSAVASSPKLLERVRWHLRVKHYSIRTEEAYVDWIRRYILFHRKRHPNEMGERMSLPRRRIRLSPRCFSSINRCSIENWISSTKLSALRDRQSSP